MPEPSKIEMEDQLESSTNVHLLLEPGRCAGACCDATAAIDFDGRSLCLEHFLPTCVSELESRNERLRNLPFDAAATDAFKTFIAKCSKQAEKIAEQLAGQPAENRGFGIDGRQPPAPARLRAA